MQRDLDIDHEAQLWLTPGSPGRDSLRRDPFPFYSRLLSHDRVYEAPDGRWLISGYAESLAFLNNRKCHTHTTEIDQAEESIAHRIFMGSMLFLDPPQHTRLRRAVSSWFNPQSVQALRDRATTHARAVLEPLRGTDGFDLRSGPAFRLPVLMIADILGLQVDDFERFQNWGKALLFLDEHPDARGEELADVNQAAEGALAFFTDVIDERRRHPTDDLISNLVNTERDDPLTDEEIVAMCVILHIGGHTTTSDLLSNGIFHMMEHPETFATLHTSPEHIPAAIEEFLRFDPPVGVTTARTVTSDIELGTAVIPSGAVVHAMLAAADRDPLVFADPDRFDVRRHPNRHIAFASGNHVCIGAHLARIEAQEFLRVLTGEFPGVHLAVDPDKLSWVDSWLHRGPTALPVAWTT